MKTAIEAIGPDAIGVCLDSGNPVWMLEDPHATLETLLPYTLTSHVRDSAVWKVPEGIAVRWVNMGEGNVDIDGWIKKFVAAKPGMPITFENLVSGNPRVHKIYDQAFWTNWSKMPASEFSRFLAVAEKGKPTPAVPRPEGKTAGQQRIEDLEKCVRYTRDLLMRICAQGGNPGDQDHFDDDKHEFEARGLVTRRQFGVLLGAGVMMMLPRVVNAVAVTEADVTVTTPDGTCDAYFVHPSTGTAAAVLLWPDIFGLRPAMRQMGKRLAESGYSVLVVNPFYRAKKAPTADQGAATPIPSLMPLAQALSETTHMTDAKAFIAWLDQQPSVARNKKIGTQGYCMGGPIAFRTALPCPIASGRRCSSGGLVTPRRTARTFRRQQAKCLGQMPRTTSAGAMTSQLKTSKANCPAEIEGLPGGGRTLVSGLGRLQQPQAEKAWGRLLALYGKALA
jgi:carboxymethylenebutenolidase